MPSSFDKPLFKTRKDLVGLYVFSDKRKQTVAVLLAKEENRRSVMLASDEKIMQSFIQHCAETYKNKLDPSYMKLEEKDISSFLDWLKKHDIEMHLSYDTNDGHREIARVHLVDDASV